MERSNDELKRLKDEAKNATGEEREALQKELAVAEEEQLPLFLGALDHFLRAGKPPAWLAKFPKVLKALSTEFAARMAELETEIHKLAGETFNVGGGVSYMTIDNEGNNLCVVLSDAKRLVLVNLISKKIVAEMDVGDYPYWVKMMGER